MSTKKLWTGKFEIRNGSEVPVATQVALTPDTTVKFGVMVDKYWHRNITHETPIFGIHYNNEMAGGESFVALAFRQVPDVNGALVGEWSMATLGDSDGIEPIKYKKLSTFTDFNKEYVFKVGYENGKLFVTLYDETFNKQASEMVDDPGRPIRFQHPEQPYTSAKEWDIPIRLINE